jgi:hypothetical protein
MTSRDILDSLRARGVEIRASDGFRRLMFRNVSDEDRAFIAGHKLELLMVLAHEAGGDEYDPRLSFLVDADGGLTFDAVAGRMEAAFAIDRELTNALIDLAIEAGYLRRHGELLEPVSVVAAKPQAREVLPA